MCVWLVVVVVMAGFSSLTWLSDWTLRLGEAAHLLHIE